MFDCEKGIWDTEYLCKKEIYHKLREIASEYSSHFAVDKQSVVNRCSDIIMTMTAVDIAPVVHARWVECDWVEPCVHGVGTIRHKNEGLKCTNCVHVFEKDLLWRDRYCPNCGARMDLEK